MSPQFKQTVYSFGALFNLMSFGMSMGFPAVLLPALQAPTSDLFITPNQASWLVSITGFAILMPVLVLGPMMHAYGRRTPNFCVAIAVAAGWVLTAFSYSLPTLFAGRFLHTLGGGAVYFIATCVAEFSSPNIRGVLLNMKMFVISVGVTIMHVLGYFLHWRHLALIGIVPSLFALLITYFWPETPDWLVLKGKFDEAEKIFYNIRGRDETTEREISKLIKEGRSNCEASEKYTMSVFMRQLHSRALWRPVVLLGFGILLPEVGGRLYFPAYSIELAKQISGDDSKGFLFTFVIDIVTLFSTTVSCYLMKRHKRRYLLLYPSYCSVVVLLTVSAILFVRTKYYDSVAMMWTSLVLLSLYFFVMTCTAFAVSFVLMGELFPLEFKASGTVISGLFFSGTYIATMKLTPLMRDYLNVHGMFFVYAICILICLFYFHYDLPETKDRTLQDIADYFKGKSPKIGSDMQFVSDHESNVILDKLKK